MAYDSGIELQIATDVLPLRTPECIEVMVNTPKETLLEQERFELRPKSGGGILSFEVWGYLQKGVTVVTRYNLAYINHSIYQMDNGRVLGFDNAHGFHHRHYMGDVRAVEFTSHEATLARFQHEWLAIVKATGGKRS